MGTLDPAITYYAPHSGRDEVDAGDINNDGLTDFIVMSGQTFVPSISTLIQASGGSFNSPIYYNLGLYELTKDVAIGDVNSDGLKDIVVTYGGNSPFSKIGIFYQNISGTINPAISYDSYDIPQSVVISDVDNDGRQDIIVAHSGWHALGVYRQGNNGIMFPEELYPLPYTYFNPHNNLQWAI